MNDFAKAIEFIRSADYTMRGKQKILETAYVEEIDIKNSWRVIGFTRGYIDALRENDFDVTKVKTNRCHLYKRRDTAEHVINSDISAEEALQYMKDRDICILALPSENKDDGSLKIEAGYEMNTSLGYFPGAQVTKPPRPKYEGVYLKERFGG